MPAAGVVFERHDQSTGLFPPNPTTSALLNDPCTNAIDNNTCLQTSSEGGEIIPESRGAIISEQRGGFIGISTKPSPIHIVAVLTAKTGQADNLRQTLMDLVPMVVKEPGCIKYSLHEDINSPGVFVFYETWTDQLAIDAHGKTPYFRALIAKFDTLLAEPLKVTFLKVII